MIVYLEAVQFESGKMSPPVFTSLTDGERMGGKIPRFIVTDPNSSETWEQVPNIRFAGKGAKSAFREVEKSVKAKLVGWKASDGMVIPEGNLDWAKPGNRFHCGTFIGVKGDKLILKIKKDGKKASLALKDFTPATQAYARELNELLKAKKLAEKMPKLESETWTSSDGKPLVATFVELKDDSLTVKTAAGKSYTFDLARLDEASQERAKEVATEVAKALRKK